VHYNSGGEDPVDDATTKAQGTPKLEFQLSPPATPGNETSTSQYTLYSFLSIITDVAAIQGQHAAGTFFSPRHRPALSQHLHKWAVLPTTHAPQIMQSRSASGSMNSFTSASPQVWPRHSWRRHFEGSTASQQFLWRMLSFMLDSNSKGLRPVTREARPWELFPFWSLCSTDLRRDPFRTLM
jgi:hypothetical protein